MRIIGNQIHFGDFKVVLASEFANEPYARTYLGEMADELAECTNAAQAASALFNCNNDGSWQVITLPNCVEVPST